MFLGGFSLNKSEYQTYLSSEHWKSRRAEFLSLSGNGDCYRCGISRELAKSAYGHDLHVHHTSYEHLGDEYNAELEPLCRRCHEVESLGSSTLLYLGQECPYCTAQGKALYTVSGDDRACEDCLGWAQDRMLANLLLGPELIPPVNECRHGLFGDFTGDC